jgi:hypothetical protein
MGSEKFPEIFTGGNFPYDVRASFYLAYFFYRIIHVLLQYYLPGMFRESFRKFSSLDMGRSLMQPLWIFGAISAEKQTLMTFKITVVNWKKFSFSCRYI